MHAKVTTLLTRKLPMNESGKDNQHPIPMVGTHCELSNKIKVLDRMLQTQVFGRRKNKLRSRIRT